MIAKIKPRIQLEDREPLKDRIPLSTPWVIFVDPSDLCNFRCRFCPSGDARLMKKVGRSLKCMDFELYKKIIDDICDFDNPIKVLRLYKDGEPLLNPKFPNMIKYAKFKGCAEKIDTTTNAYLLNKELSLKIIESGLDRINISIEGIDARQYLEFSKVKIDFDKLVENIKYFYDNRKQCEMIIKINGDIISEGDRKKFFRIFGDITDGIFIEHTMNCWNEFKMDGIKQNEEVGIYGQPIKKVDVCPYIFYSFSVNSDGRVSMCFLDWARKLIIGDVRRQNMREIWNSEKLKGYRKGFLSLGKNIPSICSDCSQLSHGLPVDLDKHAKTLLERLK